MRNVIITGSTGFLGNALIHKLVENNDKVTAVVRPNSKRINKISALKNVKIIEAELHKPIILPDNDYDVFFHLAWEGKRNDFEQQYKNINISVNCLKTAIKYNCKKFICTGSQAEYGETDKLITEETPVNPTTSYGAAKAAAYYLTRDLAKQYNIELFWIRVFSVYGENDNDNTLYSQLSKAINTSKDFHLSTDGKHIWNFLHETDAAQALYLTSVAKINGGIYNLASKESKPLCEYVEIMNKNNSSVITYGEQKSKINLNVNAEKLRKAIGEYEKINFSAYKK